MRLPYWLLRLLPLFDYVCPKCQKDVPKNSHECPHCHEKYPMPLKLPPSILKDKKLLEDYVHKHVFPRVSQAYREYLTQFFTELFNNGFEEGNFSAWTGTEIGSGNTAEVSNAQAHHGTYSGHFIGQAGVWNARCYKTFTAGLERYVRWYIRFVNFPSVDGYQIRFGAPLGGASTEVVRFFFDQSSGNKRINIQGFPWVQAGAYNYAFQNNTWYCVEYGFKSDASTGFHKVWLDGSLVINLTDRNTSSVGSPSRTDMGVHQCINFAGEFYVDCVVVADAYIGPEAAGGVVIPVMMHHYSQMSKIHRG